MTIIGGRRWRRWFRDQRGSAILFTTGMLFFLLALVGMAVDIAYLTTAHGEVQRSLDAAALAGAGKLGFNDTVFPAARSAAATFGSLNPYRNPSGGTISLGLNSGNSSSGNIVLGIYNGLTGTFTPSVDGTFVNSVRCQWSTTIPTTFLRFIGLPTLTVAAMSTAVSAPPSTIPQTACMFPIAVTACPFASGGNYGSGGCGQPMSTFSPSTSNTAAWLNVSGTGTPSANDTRNAIQSAAGGGCAGSPLDAGEFAGTNNGMQSTIFNGTGSTPGLGKRQGGQNDNASTWGACVGYFCDKWSTGTTYTVTDSGGTVTYNGRGWEVYVAVISTPCPPGSITGDHQIMTFSRMIITQVINGGRCVVTNHYPGNIWDQYCKSPDNSGTVSNTNLNAVFGYYECAKENVASSVVIPAPRSALATRLRVVQ